MTEGTWDGKAEVAVTATTCAKGLATGGREGEEGFLLGSQHSVFYYSAGPTMSASIPVPVEATPASRSAHTRTDAWSHLLRRPWAT